VLSSGWKRPLPERRPAGARGGDVAVAVVIVRENVRGVNSFLGAFPGDTGLQDHFDDVIPKCGITSMK
jgi:hypothetical protein